MGKAISDPEATGLSYQKQRDIDIRIYARWRGMNKGTGDGKM